MNPQSYGIQLEHTDRLGMQACLQVRYLLRGLFNLRELTVLPQSRQ